MLRCRVPSGVRRVLPVVLTLSALFAPPTWTEAADLWVTSRGDSGPGTLRQAIADASPGDTIRFSPELSERTITLASQLIVDKNLTINGRDAHDLQISGNDATRILNIGNDGAACGITVWVNDLRLVHARLGMGEGHGSAILTCATSLNVQRVSFEDHFTWDGGALSQPSGSTWMFDSQFVRTDGGGGGSVLRTMGGMLVVEGVTVWRCYGLDAVQLDNTTAEFHNFTFVENAMDQGNPFSVGFGSDVLVQNSTFAGNSTTSNVPGVLVVFGTLRIRNSIVSASIPNCSVWGTLLDLGNNLQHGDTSCGFGITADPQFGTLGVYGLRYVPTLPIASASPARNAGDNTHCLLNDARALQRPRTVADPCDIGAFEYDGPLTATVTNLNDSGAGSLRQAMNDVGSGATIGFQAGLTGTLLLDSYLPLVRGVTINGPGAAVLTLARNASAGAFNLIREPTATCALHLTVRGVTLREGAGGNGAAINLCGSLMVEDARFTANGVGASGNTVHAQGSAHRTILRRVRFDANQGSAALRASTYAMFVFDSSFDGPTAGIAAQQPALLLRNVSISAGTGSGLQTFNLRTALEHVTIESNWRTLEIASGFGPISVANSILAGGFGCNGTGYESRGHNVIHGHCPELTSDPTTIQDDPRLGPFTLNAPGTVATRALTIDSQAIDLGDPAYCPATDARGVARPAGAACDAGAFEAHVITLAPGSLSESPIGVPLATTVSASGAYGATTFAVTSGVLPAGITLASDGALSGTPTVAGSSTFTITATDGTGVGVRRAYTLVVNGIPTMTGFQNASVIWNGALGPVEFTVGDDLTSPAALMITASSSNQVLVPDANITIAGSGATRTLTAAPVAGEGGTAIMTVTVSDGVLTSTSTFTLTVMPTYYLAEGATGAFFDLDLLLANPRTSAVPVSIRFLDHRGATQTHDVTLAPTSRTTIRVDEIARLDATAVSMVVTSTTGAPIVVERTMRWDATGYGAHTEKATAGLAPVWHFAEGSQGFFATYLLLANPHDVENRASVAYFREGAAALVREYPLPPRSRVTIDAGDDPELLDRSFGARVTFDRPGVAERAMYFGAPSQPLFAGGHASAGVTAPATSWFLAEGATGGYFDTFVLVSNPNTTDAEATFTFFPAGGMPITRTHTVPAEGRLTLNIAREDLALASAAVATRVESMHPIVVERSQYWPQPAWHEAHNSFGVTAAGTHWGLAEGRVGGTSHTQTYILLANPGTDAAEVNLTFLRENGTTIAKTITVPAATRMNVAIGGPGSDVPELADESFGATITATHPIIVERSMYTDTNGLVWAAGTNATATRLP